MYIITGNIGKYEEFKRFFPNIKQIDYDLPEIQELDSKKIILIKLLKALKSHEGPFIVEDTSLYINDWNGLPGPLIKWFLKSLGLDGIAKLAKGKEAVAETMIGYAVNKDEIYFFEGKLKGTIVEPKGDNDFGWGPIFIPKGKDLTFAEMSREEKDSISMRKQAIMKLKKFLNSES
ncbi:MAG: non-canonical purine NTP pyrophosphatase [archaeon]